MSKQIRARAGVAVVWSCLSAPVLAECPKYSASDIMQMRNAIYKHDTCCNFSFVESEAHQHAETELITYMQQCVPVDDVLSANRMGVGR